MSSKHIRRTPQASIAGVLLIVGIVAAVVAAEIVPDLGASAPLPEPGSRRIGTAALVYIAAAGASVGIAIAVHPVLAGYHRTLALGAVVFRTIEASFYIVAVVALVAVQGVLRATPDPVGGLASRTDAGLLLIVRDQATLCGVMAFGVGASLYYIAFLRSRLLPRWLAGWGLGGTALMLTACVLALYSGTPVTAYGLFILPILTQELAMAGWLLFAGARLPNPATVATAPA